MMARMVKHRPGRMCLIGRKGVTTWVAHIAIVAQVPEYTEGMSVDDYMNGIVLIEAEYTNKIQSVIRKLSVGDYNRGDIPVGRQIYNNFMVLDQIHITSVLDPISLNCQSWAIRRLK